jgi:hypothetical protein
MKKNIGINVILLKSLHPLLWVDLKSIDCESDTKNNDS